jgi:hypothetical protein
MVVKKGRLRSGKSLLRNLFLCPSSLTKQSIRVSLQRVIWRKLSNLREALLKVYMAGKPPSKEWWGKWIRFYNNCLLSYYSIINPEHGMGTDTFFYTILSVISEDKKKK